MGSAIIEITTQIGCFINCHFCPQERLLNAYRELSRTRQMTLEVFCEIVDKLPEEVDIHFSGFCEPWLNPHCTDMVCYAAQKNHRVAIYTTLQGMTLQDFNAIKHIPFKIFSIHLPDEAQNTRIDLTPEYLELLEHILEHFKQDPTGINFSLHGEIHPEITEALPTALQQVYRLGQQTVQLIDRAGNLTSAALNHQHVLEPLQCKISGTTFNKNILLPDGTVVLCCMDYALSEILGNLRTMDYQDLFSTAAFRAYKQAVIEGQETLCSYCSNARLWQPPYQMIPIDMDFPVGEDIALFSVTAHLAKFSHRSKIMAFEKNAEIAYKQLDLEDSIPLIELEASCSDNPSHQSWQAIRGLMELVPFAVVFLPVPNLASLNAQQRRQKIHLTRENLTQTGLAVDQIGWKFGQVGQSGLIIIFEQAENANMTQLPENFRVVAILNTFNEEDIIIPTLQDLVDQGVDIYMLDNWSTDNTYDLAKTMLGKGLIGLERWPENGVDRYYDLEETLKAKERISQQIDADWFIHHDADEIRESPWPGLTLREAIWKVDQLGYNAIDFTVLNFLPVDNGFPPGSSFKAYFRYCEFGQRPGFFKQVKAWKSQESPAILHKSAGHNVFFPGRRVFPYKFLMRHYPYRSQAHAEKKVFEDRNPRYDPEKKKEGWHRQYDRYQRGSNFLNERTSLIEFNEDFYTNYLIERLTGFGIQPLSGKNFQLPLALSKEIRSLSSQNQQIKGRLEAAKKQVHNQNQKIAQLRAQLTQADHNIAYYTQSRSWRITKPLRKLIDFIRKMRPAARKD